MRKIWNYSKTPLLVAFCAFQISNLAQAKDSDSENPILTQLDHQTDRLKAAAPSLLKSLNLDAALDLFSAQVVTGMQVKGRYELKVLPAYKGSDFLRIDHWQINPDLNLLESMRVKSPRSFPVGFSADVVGEAYFITKYDTQMEALNVKNIKWEFSDIPFTADVADKMQNGESVIFDIPLTLSVGMTTPSVGSFVQPYLDGVHFIQNRFQVQISKFDHVIEDKSSGSPQMRVVQEVRVRLIGLKQEASTAEAGLKLWFNVWSTIGNSLIGKRVAVTSDSAAIQSVVLSDYIFNFHTSDEAQNAKTVQLYNDLLSPRLRLPARLTLNPLSSAESLQEFFISDLGAVDQAANEALANNIPFVDRGVTRVFSGNESGHPKQWALKLGVDFINFKASSNLDLNKKIVFLDGSNQEVKFGTPTVSRVQAYDHLWGSKHDEFSRSASLILPLDKNGNPTTQQNGESNLGDYVVTVQSKDSFLQEDYKENLIRFAKRQLAPEIIQVLGLENAIPDLEYQNARLFARITVKQPAFDYLKNLSLEEMRIKMAEYLAINATNMPGRSLEDIKNWAANHQAEIDKIVVKLHDVFTNPTYSSSHRIKTFVGMQFMTSQLGLVGWGDKVSSAFGEIGTGYIIHLLPPDKLADLVHVYMTLDATAFKKTQILPVFGQSDSSGIAQVVEYINNLYSKGSFDLRLETYGSANPGSGMSFKDGDVINVETLKKSLGRNP
jgi:hypothetical protein